MRPWPAFPRHPWELNSATPVRREESARWVMSIHLDGLNPDIRDDVIEFPADVNGKRILLCYRPHDSREAEFDNWR